MDKLYFINSKVESNSVPFGSILEETREKTVIENEDTLLSCAINGIYRNDELFSHFRGSSNIGYIKIKKNDLVLSAQNLHLGNANVNLRFEHGIISPAYKAYRVIGAVPEYMAQWVKRPQANQFFLDATTEGASQCRKNIDWDTLYAQNIQLPSIEIQEKIATLLSSVDTKIKVEKIKVEKLKAIKKSMLGKMFPKEGASVPEIRFKGFTDDWEQRKFSDLVTIERGGSPRPIDKYITNDKNGLNWIKIGDAPEQGNYITQTAEKIKPEGLSKTREVHPGDLILSNSMSFGRPYIMAIDGCIHDGWLAIRDTEKNFDLKFLCTLLGTDNMLNQYKSMAAGSTVNNLNKELVGGTKVLLPIINEQVQIGQYFSQIDNLITLHQRKYEKLLDVKKAFLEKLIGGDN